MLSQLTEKIDKKSDSSNSLTSSANQTDYQAYLTQSEKQIATLTGKDKTIRDKALNELIGNQVYDTLVNHKVMDQKYLVILQAVGNSMIYEQDSTFSVSEAFEDKLKETPGALKLTLKLIQLDMHGGIPKEILDVYTRYVNVYRVSGHKGDGIYNAADGSLAVKIENDFTITEALTIFQYHYPAILDDLYEAKANGLANWSGEKATDYRYSYLVTKTAFNDYLGVHYPDSKNYIRYDFAISAPDLYADYEANEVSADDKYKNKIIAVSGTVESINKDFLDKPYIILGTNNYLSAVACSFEDEKKLKSLSKGDYVTIIGKCVGKTNVFGSIISLSECRMF